MASYTIGMAGIFTITEYYRPTNDTKFFLLLLLLLLFDEINMHILYSDWLVYGNINRVVVGDMRDVLACTDFAVLDDDDDYLGSTFTNGYMRLLLILILGILLKSTSTIT